VNREDSEQSEVDGMKKGRKCQRKCSSIKKIMLNTQLSSPR